MYQRLKITIICLFLVCHFGSESLAQNSDFYSGGAHTLSLGRAGTMLTGTSALYTNPAGIMYTDSLGVDVSYDRRYNLDELATVSLAGGKIIGNNAIGVSISRFGYSAYSESRAGFSYARKIFDNVSVGGTFNYLGYNIDGFGNATRFTFGFGVQSKINKNVSIGAHVFNPASVSFNDDQDIPARMSIGLKYRASSKADIYLDVSKTIDRNPDFVFAVDYRLIDAFSIRLGANITQSSIHFGPAYHFKNGLSILGGYVYDNRLGHTTGLSISYSRS